MATGEDLRWSTTEGGQPSLSNRLMHWYLDQVRLLTAYNPNTLKAFMDVLHLVKSPATLFQPDILAQVLKGAFNGHRQDEQSALLPGDWEIHSKGN